MRMKIWLVLYNTEKKYTFTKYFETEFMKDKYKRRLKYIKNLILIEDSTDIYFLDQKRRVKKMKIFSRKKYIEVEGFDDYYISTLKHFQDLLRSSNDSFKFRDKFHRTTLL